MRSPERLRYLPEPPRASEWEEEDEDTDDAVICWPKGPELVVHDALKKEETQNGMVLGNEGEEEMEGKGVVRLMLMLDVL